MSKEVVIVAAARTAVGSFGGSLAGVPAHRLGATVVKSLLERTGLKADQVDEVILGQVLTAGVGQNPARQTVIEAGLSLETPAMTINKVCGSGLKSIMLAADAVRLGDARIVLAGGFCSYVDLAKAITIGLLPEIDPDRVTFVGNGSLMGAKMSALTNRIRRDVVEVTRKMTNFELSETPSYMDNYVAALFLPHTDLNQFPKLKARLDQRRALLNS
jgi:acetyl-CoA acetyltransferase